MIPNGNGSLCLPQATAASHPLCCLSPWLLLSITKHFLPLNIYFRWSALRCISLHFLRLNLFPVIFPNLFRYLGNTSLILLLEMLPSLLSYVNLVDILFIYDFIFLMKMHRKIRQYASMRKLHFIFVRRMNLSKSCNFMLINQ